MSRFKVIALLNIALGTGDFKSYRQVLADDALRHKRAPKGHRLKDRNSAMHETIRQRHMSSEKAQTGMTGKQLKKKRKAAMKARKRLEKQSA